MRLRCRRSKLPRPFSSLMLNGLSTPGVNQVRGARRCPAASRAHRRRHREAPAEALVDPELRAVIRRTIVVPEHTALRVEQAPGSEDTVRGCSRSAPRAPRRSQGRPEHSRVPVAMPFQFLRQLARVAHLEARSCELPLHGQVHRLRVRHDQVRIRRDQIRGQRERAPHAGECADRHATEVSRQNAGAAASGRFSEPYGLSNRPFPQIDRCRQTALPSCVRRSR